MPNEKIITVELDDYILHHNLSVLATQFSTTINILINISIRRLLDDVEFVRELRKGNFNSASFTN